MGAVGAQYNISSRVGIYVEPGVSYFFDDGSDIETIRKKSLQLYLAGVEYS